MADDIRFDPDTEWLHLARPQGLVVSAHALKELNLVPQRQTPVDTADARQHIAEDEEKPALADPWRFFADVLGWRAQDVAGAPDGAPIPEHLVVRLADLGTTLEPTWAVRAGKGAAEDGPSHQLLVRIEARGIKPDEKKARNGWEATPQQRFERLLRDTKVHAGLLITDEEIRLVYAPQGETSGWQAFPIRALAGVPGRPILAGLKLLLERPRLFGEPTQRLPVLLQKSRDAQAGVSTALSAQVLGALHELLRGVLAAETTAKRKLIEDLARTRPHHLYEGLLTVLMRLVFVLYAEDRDLIPSKTDKEARWLYDQGYSVRGLFARLTEDEALNPDTMDERVGGWGQMLALFRLIHKGHGSGFIRARGGKLFDPDAFPFLEGRADQKAPPVVMAVSDGCLLRVLRGLMVLDGERLSYRALDVEAIGSVYETVMGFTVEMTTGTTVAIKAGKNNKTPVFVDLDALLPLKATERIKRIKEDTGRALTGKAETQVKAAKSMPELLAALDNIVDERGSPERRPVPAGTPVLQPTDERRRTGSHYTPRSLTEPIVRHALEPTFERLGENATPEQILDLKVCDPAMGSGAFLVEACRQLGARLQQAWDKHAGTRPKFPEDETEELHAKRLVAQRCLYGVDKNPMATDLAKLSLWLATLARDHEFEFVDHALKTGDSLVGLSVEQIASATWDQSQPGLPLFQKLVRDRVKESLLGRQEIRDAPDDVFRAVQEARHKNAEERIMPMRVVGDAVISAFFAQAKDKARQKERARIESLITGQMTMNLTEVFSASRRLATGEHPIQPFHWQLEFPEVFQGSNPGFDAIFGNPPFLGGSFITRSHGNNYFAYLTSTYEGCIHHCDLVGYFVRRMHELLKRNATAGFLATKTIAQGDTREGALRYLLERGTHLCRVRRAIVWPGEASVVVDMIHLFKGKPGHAPELDGRTVDRISAFLFPGTVDASPKQLSAAPYMSQGSQIYGKGFLFDDSDEDANSVAILRDLIAAHPEIKSRIFPFFGGDEVNGTCDHAAHRHVIYLSDLGDESELAACEPLAKIVREKVYPERMLLRDTSSGKQLKKKWWAYQAHRPALYSRVRNCQSVIVNSLVSSHLTFAVVSPHAIYSHKLGVIPDERMSMFALVQNRTHEIWAKFLSSPVGDGLSYSPSDCFRTFPLPSDFESDAALEAAGQAYHDHRAALMIANNEGLTKTYNRFHDEREDSAEIVKLRELHDAMDRAVLRAYGWSDLADRVHLDADAMPRHLTEDTEDDHKYQGRYFWPAPVRDAVLARLLALNAERAEEEKKAGKAPAAQENDETDDADSGED